MTELIEKRAGLALAVRQDKQGLQPMCIMPGFMRDLLNRWTV
jgi:hypothetical protein